MYCRFFSRYYYTAIYPVAFFYRSHKFPCRSLLLSTTVLNDILMTYVTTNIDNELWLFADDNLFYGPILSWSDQKTLQDDLTTQDIHNYKPISLLCILQSTWKWFTTSWSPSSVHISYLHNSVSSKVAPHFSNYY